MRKFKFVGDPLNYFTKGDRFIIEHGKDYDFDSTPIGWVYPISFYVKNIPEDWEEVTDHVKRIPNQDQPSSSMTKFEMAVFMVLQGLNANPEYYDNDDIDLIKCAVNQVKETFKQLENETNNSG
jgi:CRISPR/Cas system CSM-associated protein Csm5 (group 7 of RAMP superfamily)